MEVIEISHPLLLNKLSSMRKKETSSRDFRDLLEEISIILAYEVTKNAPLKSTKIKTPLEEIEAPFLSEDFALISILRSGEGMLSGMLKMLPNASIGHIGVYRNPENLEAIEYYCKLPKLEKKKIILLDPMLATGNSAVYALSLLEKLGDFSIDFVCLLAAPEGVNHLQKKYPNVKIFTVKVDERLNEKGYILPGLGDAGDRLFCT